MSLAEELEHVKAEAEEAKEATESLKADIARRDLQAEKGKPSTDLSQPMFNIYFYIMLLPVPLCKVICIDD